MPETPALLIPIAVEALLVNNAVNNTVPFLRWSNDWTQLATFTDPAPPPFGNTQAVELGVHLHWTLPSALTHGTGAPDGTTHFPFLPNRWLVMRLISAKQSTAPAVMNAWIVESDYSASDGAVPWVDAASTPANLIFTRIGRSVDLSAWKESGKPAFITATGIADVTFTAYQPGVTNVFGFYDPMTGVAEGACVTYLVAGWYGRAADDPLASQTPQSLDWNVLGASDGQTPPTVGVYHGLAVDLTWQTKTAPARADANASALQLGVANTSIDALAAILGARAAQKPGIDVAALVQKLEAFQYNTLQTLNAPDASAQLELKIRSAWFGATPGGTLWTFAPLSQGQTTSDPLGRDVQATPPPATPAQLAWLATLNQKQRQYDVAARSLQTLRTQLFGLWWKSKRIASMIATAPAQVAQQNGWGIDIAAIGTALTHQLDPKRTGSFANRVVQAQGALATLAAAVPNPAQSDPSKPDSPQTWSRQIPGYDPTTGPVLRPQALPTFAHPADPVVLVAGLTAPPNAPASGSLTCRLATAAVNGAAVGSTTVSAAMASKLIANPSGALGKNVSPLVAQALGALAVETFFADPNEATAIAGLAGVSDPKAIQQLVAAIGAGTAQRASIADPLQARFAFALWQQAWSPLFLEWVITWKPSIDYSAPIGQLLPPPSMQSQQDAGGAQDNWAFAPDNWTFNGADDVTDRGSEYYTWAGGGDLPGWKNPWSSSGRTFLTPQTTSLFLKRLREYVAVHPDTDLSEVLALIGQTNFLSQSLGGFNAQWNVQTAMQAVPPFGDPAVVTAIGEEFRAIPFVALGNQDFDFSGGTPFFMPLRGGYFQFEKLHLVDRFGQVLDLLQANGNAGDAATFTPICGAGTAPEANLVLSAPARLVRQAPRIVQPSRLDLRLLDAADDTKEIGYAAGANPICGFFLPNHLDHAIAVYDASGIALGEFLVLAQTSGTPAVRWLSAPGSTITITDPAKIANLHLRNAVLAFTAPSGGIPTADRVAAFKALYAAIDETLGMIDPAGGLGDRDLAALIGRPLAVVRAQVNFELFGSPATNQTWRDTFDLANPDDPSSIQVGAQTANFTTFSLPIRLGSVELLDDGLVGYYVTDNYTQFNAVHASASVTSPHVVPIVPNNYLKLPFDYPKYSRTTLTLLLDPRGVVHGTTGILPTATLAVGPEFYSAALAQMAVTFRIGPLLTDLQTIRLPVPTARSGTWSWIRATAPGPTYETDGVLAADARARFPDTPPHLVDGWLAFTPKSNPS
jgi:hypothetical protein